MAKESDDKTSGNQTDKALNEDLRKSQTHDRPEPDTEPPQDRGGDSDSSNSGSSETDEG